MNETRFPLCWPNDWKRTPNREPARFKKQRPQSRSAEGQTMWNGFKSLSIEDSFERIEYEMERFGVDLETVIVSTNLRMNMRGMPAGNQSEPSDPGVAVYWILKGKSQCIAIDRYTRVADNLAAIAATLDALRAIERHGGGSILERAFIGFAALPASRVDWRAVLQFHPARPVTAEDIQASYRALAAKRHPDSGGSNDSMAELNAARAAALEAIRA